MSNEYVVLTDSFESSKRGDVVAVPAEKAAEIKEGGKGHVLKSEHVQDAENRISEAVAEFHRQQIDIKMSDNPLMTHDVVEWEINKRKQELEKAVKDIQKEYEDKHDSIVRQAEEQDAKQFVSVTESDKQAVNSKVDDYLLDVEFDSLQGAERLQSFIEHATDGQIQAIKRRVSDIKKADPENADNLIQLIRQRSPIPISESIRQLPDADSVGAAYSLFKQTYGKSAEDVTRGEKLGES